MNKKRNCLLGLAFLMLGLAGGAALGILVGWVIWPVNYVDTEVVDLRAGYQDDYILMVSDAYFLDGDLAQAQRRLSYLSAPDVRQRVTALIDGKMAAGESPENVRSLVILAQGLRVDTQEMLEYIVTHTPTLTPWSTSTSIPTKTPISTTTPTMSATKTPAPTATAMVTASSLPTSVVIPSPIVPDEGPSPIPGFAPTGEKPVVATVAPLSPSEGISETGDVDFVVVSQRMLHKTEVGGCEAPSIINLKVIDLTGHPVDGVVIRIAWDGGEFPAVGSGSKGPGTAEAAAWSGDYYVEVIGNVGGEKLSSDRSRLLRTAYPSVDDLRESGYCESSDAEECQRRRDNNELCTGHYSYEVIFQRQW